MKKYIAYLKDNPQGYWFKRKLYGWGWTPVKWQGWLVLALCIAGMVWGFPEMVRDQRAHQYLDSVLVLGVIVKAVVFLSLLIFVCYKKGEKPRWQWGLPKDK